MGGKGCISAIGLHVWTGFHVLFPLQAGKSVGSMKSFHDLYSPSNVAFLLAVGSLALLPIALKRKALQGIPHQPPPPRKLSIRQGLAPLLPLAATPVLGTGKHGGSNEALPIAPDTHEL